MLVERDVSAKDNDALKRVVKIFLSGRKEDLLEIVFSWSPLNLMGFCKVVPLPFWSPPLELEGGRCPLRNSNETDKAVGLVIPVVGVEGGAFAKFKFYKRSLIPQILVKNE